MYTVLALMLVGMALGHLLRAHLSRRLLGSAVTLAVLLLLFLLGLELGGDVQVFARLHLLGAYALVITIGALSGTIAVGMAWQHLYGRFRGHPRAR